MIEGLSYNIHRKLWNMADVWVLKTEEAETRVYLEFPVQRTYLTAPGEEET